jgi:hypothetical protein
MSLENEVKKTEVVETPAAVLEPEQKELPTLMPLSESETSIVTQEEKALTSEEVPAEEAPEVVAEDEEYEIELSADSPLTEEELNEIAADAERLNLSKEDAMKLVALKESAYKKGAETVEGKYNQKLQSQFDEMSAHPEFSGDKAKESWGFLAKAVKGFGDEKFMEMINSPEVGNLVPLALFLKKVGQAMAPDSTPPSGKGTAPANETNSESEALARQYPAFFKEKA